LERNGTEAEIVFYEAEDSSITDINEENKSNFTELGNFIISNLVTKEDKQASLEITVKVTTSGYMILKCRDKKNENDKGEVKEIGKSEDDQQISAQDQSLKYAKFTAISFSDPKPKPDPEPKIDVEVDVKPDVVVDVKPDVEVDVKPDVEVDVEPDVEVKPPSKATTNPSSMQSFSEKDFSSDDDDSDIPEYESEKSEEES